MLDSVKLKALKKQIIKKDEEIAALKEQMVTVEKENAELRARTYLEMEKVKEAAEEAAEAVKAYREKLLETEKLHHTFLLLIEKTKEMNEDYRRQIEDVIGDAKKTKGEN